MKHGFQGSYGDTSICIVCGYTEISHGKEATCEACGTITVCEFFPDTKHPKKMLLCEPCIQKEYTVAREVTQARVNSYEVVRTPGDYFNANISAIKEIKEAIEADPSIEHKSFAVAEAIKLRLNHLKKTLIEKRNEISTLENEQRESQIFLNHHMKQLSDDEQKRLGLLDITYKPSLSNIKVPRKAPATKKFDKDELRRVANSFNIDITVLQMIVTRRQVSIEEAAKIYIQASNKVDSQSN